MDEGGLGDVGYGLRDVGGEGKWGGENVLKGDEGGMGG